jgi:translation initiation factor 3 subunit B
VYEAPEMGLLDKKSVKLDAVQDFSWSPADPILCAYQVEQGGGNLPARLSLMAFPERTELRQKNLFSVADVQMFWHPQGTYLAVQVDRFTKTKKSIYTSFELFSLKERSVPAEVLELPQKGDRIIHFAWEPHGTRFAILHGDGPKPNLSVYEMKDVRSAVKAVQPVVHNPSRAANVIHWSPTGKNMVLAGLKQMNGQLEFYNVEEAETMATGEHFMCTDIEWDPTGRYVATVVTSVHQMENGFNLWSWNGNLMYRVMRDRFYQFSWRPRPPSLLSEADLKEIARNLRKYSEKYAKEDDVLMAQADTDLLSDRRARIEEWREWYEGKRAHREQMAAAAHKIISQRYPELVNKPDDYTIEQETVEEVIGHQEEVWTG